MSEKIFAWLLRFYPANFRQAHGEDALQLFRDRSRDEKGFFPHLRLWLDLLADLAVSVPRGYAHAQPALDGTSLFHVLEGTTPRPGVLLSAVLLSIAAAGGLSVLIGRGGRSKPAGAWVVQPRLQHGAREAEAAMGSGQPSAGAGIPGSSEPAPPSASGVKLDAAERHRVIDGAIANLKKYYDYPEVTPKIADALLAREKSGDDDAAADGDAFADLLTRQMMEVSHDRQLSVVYNRVKAPDRPLGPSPEMIADYREALRRNNCFFEKVEILPHNIGYLKLNSFPDPSLCQPTAAAAMASLNRADAIIFDLRDNRGGYPAMVALIAGYLFNRPTHLNDMYDRGEKTTRQSWTPPPVPGNRLADKPAYVLTSGVTFSGAEEFSYDLKMLKRATLVGEATSGRGHIPIARRIDDRFDIRVPDRRSINPISKTDWDGPGVLPDVEVNAADALATAEKLAVKKLRKR